VLPAIGEEWGFCGVAAICALFGVIVWRGLRAARRARTTYGFFLAAGLSTLIACEMLLISAGVLGALPLSGVVSPFLSSGNTAMLANFLVFAMLISISASDKDADETNRQPDELRRPVTRLALVLAGAAATLLAFAFRYQVLDDSRYLARDAFAFEEDNVKRPQHNPRINSLAREIPRGPIYDRNGIPLATSNWQEISSHREDYTALGIAVEKTTNRFDSRHYPFGAATATSPATCAPERTSTPRTRRWWSTTPIAGCKGTTTPSWRRSSDTATTPTTPPSPAFSAATALCGLRWMQDCKFARVRFSSAVCARQGRPMARSSSWKPRRAMCSRWSALQPPNRREPGRLRPRPRNFWIAPATASIRRGPSSSS